MDNKKLYKGNDKMLAGVCSGIGEYLNMDPTIVRLIWIFLGLSVGLGLLAYIIAAIVIPEKPIDN